MNMGRLKTYYSDLRDFGLRYVWEYWILGRIQGRERKHKAVTHYLQRFYSSSLTYQHEKFAISPNPYPDSIWVCWWQGEEQMPEVVKLCYKSLQKHANGHPIHLITKSNYKKYVEMPQWVLDKFEADIISITHFSDLLRLTLLSRYGGLWMDATLYLTGDLPKRIPYFFTLKSKATGDEFVSKYRWSGYCIGGAVDNPLFSEAYILLLLQYWRDHDKLINYYILDYVFDLLYVYNEHIKKIIDDNPYNNPDMMFLVSHLNLPYNEDEWTNVCENTYIHKLSWKQSYKEQCNNQNTYYCAIKNGANEITD